MLLFAELPSVHTPDRDQTTEDTSHTFAYLVLRNTHRPTSPDYLPNLLCTLDHDGRQQQVWGKKSSWDKLFQVISVEKAIIYPFPNKPDFNTKFSHIFCHFLLHEWCCGDLLEVCIQQCVQSSQRLLIVSTGNDKLKGLFS